MKNPADNRVIVVKSLPVTFVGGDLPCLQNLPWLDFSSRLADNLEIFHPPGVS